MGPCKIQNLNISSRLLILWYSGTKEELQASTNPLFFEAAELVSSLLLVSLVLLSLSESDSSSERGERFSALQLIALQQLVLNSSIPSVPRPPGPLS